MTETVRFIQNNYKYTFIYTSNLGKIDISVENEQDSNLKWSSILHHSCRFREFPLEKIFEIVKKYANNKSDIDTIINIPGVIFSDSNTIYIFIAYSSGGIKYIGQNFPINKVSPEIIAKEKLEKEKEQKEKEQKEKLENIEKEKLEREERKKQLLKDFNLMSEQLNKQLTDMKTRIDNI